MGAIIIRRTAVGEFGVWSLDVWESWVVGASDRCNGCGWRVGTAKTVGQRLRCPWAIFKRLTLGAELDRLYSVNKIR